MKLRLKGHIYFDSTLSMDSFIAEADAYHKLHPSVVYVCNQADGEEEGVLYLDMAYESEKDTKEFFDLIRVQSKSGVGKVFITTHLCNVDNDPTDKRPNDIKSYTYG